MYDRQTDGPSEIAFFPWRNERTNGQTLDLKISVVK